MSQFSILRFSFLIKLQAETCNFIKKQALTQVFSSEFCEMFRNTFFVENLWWLILTHIPQHLPLKYHMILQTHSFGTISKKVLSYLIMALLFHAPSKKIKKKTREIADLKKTLGSWILICFFFLCRKKEVLRFIVTQF